MEITLSGSKKSIDKFLFKERVFMKKHNINLVSEPNKDEEVKKDSKSPVKKFFSRK